MAITDRTERLIGKDGVQTLRNAHVLIVGIGGVGGCVFEMLCRAGVGHITVADGDVFDETNLNRQLLSSVRLVGTPKTEAARLRAAEIAPDCVITPLNMRFDEQSADGIFAAKYDYVADCIDSVADKTALIVRCQAEGIPVLSAMGAGNRIQPHFVVTDIFKTQNDGLARSLRKRLRAAGIHTANVVCDESVPLSIDGAIGTVSYAPNMCGCVMAQKIITDLVWKS